MVDRHSFILGMMTAFGECVAKESKRIALSPPMLPDDMAAIQEEAKRVADEQNLSLYLEKNEEMKEKDRVLWWVIYKFPEDLEQYQKLRREGKNPAWEFAEFADLLSYGTVWGERSSQVVPKMRENTEAMDPVTRILFPDGGWPVEK